MPGTAQVKCEHCGHTISVAQLKPIFRQVEGKPGCYDVGFTCPGCRRFYHSAYTSDELMRLQRMVEKVRHPAEHARLLRKYKGKFDRFQVEMSPPPGEAGEPHSGGGAIASKEAGCGSAS